MNDHNTEYAIGYSMDSIGEVEGSRRASRSSRRRVRRIPYDYVAKFRLTGVTGTTVPAAVNISTEAWFICTSIGYSLVEPEASSTPSPPQFVANFGPVLGSRSVLATSPAVNKTILSLPFQNITEINDRLSVEHQLSELKLLETQNMRELLSFTYAIIDKGSGRELQNEPIHNLAGLGKPDGMRPFRELVVPYVFSPNSSIVIEIREITTIQNGTVHMVFQGYKEFR